VLRCLGEHDDAVRALSDSLAEADRLRHTRLAEAAAMELAYVGLARDDASLMRVAALRLEASGGASATPVRARLARRSGAATRELAEACETLLARGDRGSLERIEIAVALVDLGLTDASSWLESGVGAYLGATTNDIDRGVRRRGIAARFVTDQPEP